MTHHLIFTVLTLLTLLSARAGHAMTICTNDDIPAVFKAWQERAERTKTIEASLELVLGHFGAFSRVQSEWMPLALDKDQWEKSQLVIHGDKVRYDAMSWTYDEHLMSMPVYDYQRHIGDYSRMLEELSTGRFQHSLYSHFTRPDRLRRNPQQLTNLFNGVQRSNFWSEADTLYAREIRLPKPGETQQHRLGAYRKLYFQACHDGAFDLDSLIYQPVMLMYRPFEPWYGGIDREHCTLEGEVTIRGRRCRKLIEKTQVDDVTLNRCFFVDPECEWTIVRYIGECGEYPSVQFDVDYNQLSDGQWTPHQWTVMRMDFKNRPLQNFATVKVANLQINKEADEISFEINQPVGTWSIDWQPMTQSLLRADGSKRQILELESDVSASYEVLMNSEPGQGYFEERLRSRLGILRPIWRAESLVVIGAFLCVLAILPRRTKSRKDIVPTPPSPGNL